MKYLDEYRDAETVHRYALEIAKIATRHWTLMEVCGGQTHAIVKFGIDELLPRQVELIHGPGCPVCVTPLEMIDKAQQIAARREVIFTSFGDMLRVPGSKGDLLQIKAEGGDVRIVYSPLEAVKLAEQNPQKEVVFFGVGFETTAPATAMAVRQASQKNLHNFSLLVSHVLVPPAMHAILAAPDNRVQGFLAAGHVCTVMGLQEYAPIAAGFLVPIVVTGFEPLDILQGVLMCIEQLESGQATVQNQYSRWVRPEGNVVAQKLIEEIYQVVPRKWRGIGEIPRSGLGLREPFSHFDAEKKFDLAELRIEEPTECMSGIILRGQLKPPECPSFGRGCTPEHPLGATMVSSEGACAAYYRYRGEEVSGGATEDRNPTSETQRKIEAQNPKATRSNAN